MDKYTGKRLDGRYEIQELIGVGGMAMVYKAHDNLDDKTVAIKILKDEFLGNEEFIRRFKNESKAIAVLSHPNIVKVYDVSFGDRIQYIVMEYIDGITLKEYIGQQEVLPWKEAVHFTVQILQALQHAHEKGIVHRDVKPQNIMLLQDGTIKVTDFGIARFSNNETRTMTDKAIGSVHYIAPEQAKGGVTDGKADIYSVGVMLYEMLTGRLPFDADSAVSVAIMQLQTEPVPLHEINENVPRGLEDITLRAMRKEPRQRYQSATEMLEAIEMFRKDPSTRFGYNYFEDRAPTKYVEKIGQPPVAKPVESYRDDYVAYDTGEIASSRAKTVVKWTTILVGILVLVAIIFFFVIVIRNVTHQEDPQQVEVPNFVGMKYEDILKKKESKVKGYNFNFNVVDANEGTEIGVVTEQDVSAGSPKVEGPKTTITLTVYTNKKRIKVPKLRNYAEQKAIDKLVERGFENYDVQRVYYANVPAGTVIDCSPQEESDQYPETVITLIVSDGPSPEQIEIPSVSGQTFDQAKKNLEALGFKTERKEVDSALESGTVVGTDPLPGNRLTKRSIAILVSNGSKMRKSMVYKVGLPEEEYGEMAIKVIQNKPNGSNVTLYDGKVIPGEGSEVKLTLDPKDADNNEIKITVMVDGVKWETAVFNFETQTSQITDADYKRNYKIKQPSLLEDKIAAYHELTAYADGVDFSLISDRRIRTEAENNLTETVKLYGDYDDKEKTYTGRLFEAKTLPEIEELLQQAKAEVDEIAEYYLEQESSYDESSYEESSEEESSEDESSYEESSEDESSDEVPENE